MPRPTTKTSKSDVGLREGFRSGLEDDVAAQLRAHGIEPAYESIVIRYNKPARDAKYTPDFPNVNGFIVETKGRFVTADRQKHILIKQQCPHLDIRFVFSNPNQRISKTSKTRYADWCIKHGFKFAKKLIPDAWLNERNPVN